MILQVHPRKKMYHEFFFDEMHKLACRHCNKGGSTLCNRTEQSTYSSILVNAGTCVENELCKIEAKNKVMEEISMFCEKCMSISVISFEYYQCKNAAMKTLLCNQVYSNETSYYVSLIRHSQNYEM